MKSIETIKIEAKKRAKKLLCNGCIFEKNTNKSIDVDTLVNLFMSKGEIVKDIENGNSTVNFELEYLVKEMIGNDYWEQKYWYAIISNPEFPDYDNGSYNLDEAKMMANKYGYKEIAVIDNYDGDDFCVEAYVLDEENDWIKENNN